MRTRWDVVRSYGEGSCWTVNREDKVGILVAVRGRYGWRGSAATQAEAIRRDSRGAASINRRLKPC